jgi:predicted ester cyclase
MQTPLTTGEAILNRNINAVNSRDIEAYLANQRPDVEFVLPGGTVLRGREPVRLITETMWTAFPDGQLSFGDSVINGDAAAVEVVFTGTHTGPLATPSGELAPTGRAVTTRTVSMLRFRDGMIASEHVYGDQFELLSQLGLKPDDAH